MIVKNFFVYKIFTQPFNPELISGVFWEFEISGLVEEDDHIKIFVSEDSDISPEAIENSLNKIKSEDIISSFTIERELLEDKNWNELWEQSREVIHVSDRIIIKPSFKEYLPGENEIVLTIDPKMSFGTGEHQSTKLVLKLLENYGEKGMKVLDVGSGTGILGIAAIKLGAAKAVVVDFDETCYENCKENCLVNGVADSIEILTGEINVVKENNFDLIVANIQKNVLIEIADKIKSRLKQNGKVILAGLLASDQEDIEAKYHSLGFRTDHIEQIDEWVMKHPAPLFAQVHQSSATAGFNSESELKNITAPTLILQGDSDFTILPKNAELLAERIPNSKLQFIEGAAHFVIIEKYEEFNNAVMSFINEVERG